MAFQLFEGEIGEVTYNVLNHLNDAHELQRRLDTTGASTIAVAAHPGASNTNLGAHLGDTAWYWKLVMPVMMTMAQSSAMGALPTMWAAVGLDVKGGDYYGPGSMGKCAEIQYWSSRTTNLIMQKMSAACGNFLKS